MNKRSNEDKLELFADLLEPAATILADEEISKARQTEKMVTVIKIAIKRHKGEILEMLARLEGEDPAAYELDGVRVLIKLLALFNDPANQALANELFTGAAQSAGAGGSGAATENTGAGAN